MRYVQIVVDGVLYTLRQNVNGEWAVTNRAPYVAGEYPVTVIATTEHGQELVFDVTDPELVKALTLIVTENATVSGERMLNYWPEAIQQILEFQAFIKPEGFEVDFLSNDIELAVNEAYLLTMGEERVASWEKALGIFADPSDTLQDRRDAVIARIRGQGKLNTALINAIVSAFTGGTADSYIENSTLYVKITPPPGDKQYKFENVVRELEKKVPAHLGLHVTRNYSTWGEIKNNFTDWNAVGRFETWNDVNLWIGPQ